MKSFQLVGKLVNLLQEVNIYYRLYIAYCDSINVFQLSAASQGHEGSFKKYKNAFLNDSKSQKEVFGHFLELGLLDRLDVAYCDSTECFPT